MYFDILDKITYVETIAVDSSIREVARLKKVYGSGVVSDFADCFGRTSG